MKSFAGLRRVTDNVGAPLRQFALQDGATLPESVLTFGFDFFTSAAFPVHPRVLPALLENENGVSRSLASNATE